MGKVPDMKASEAEVKMARQLVKSLSSDFRPEQLHDDYRESLLKLIEEKARSGHVQTTPSEEGR